MSIKRRLASHTIRMVSLYVLFLLISVFGFLVLTFGAVGVEIENNVKSEIDREHAQITGQLTESPTLTLEQALAPYIRRANPLMSIYILKGPNGTLASNYPYDVSLSPGWQHLDEIKDAEVITLGLGDDDNEGMWGDFDILPGNKHDEGYIGKVTTHGNQTIFIGRTLDRIDETKAALTRIALLVLPLSLILAILGGYIIDRVTMRRIEVINEQCRAIRQKGDISLRVPNKKPDDEYGLLIANINAMLETIDQNVQNIQVVSDDVAHDLRTPLTRIKYGLESGLLDTKASAKELKSVIESSLGETDNLLETFSAILRIAQLNTGRRKSKFADFDLSELAATMVEAYEPIAEEKGHSLRCELNTHHCLIHGDKDMLTQLISNLIENCFSHAGNTLAILVKVDCGRDDITLSVSDTGIGVSQADSEKIFDKFYRADKSRSAPGSGLGLSIVKAVSDLHDGKIIVADNRPGLKISIIFPRMTNLTD